MTARPRITQAELAQAATIARTEGVTVTITAPNGKVYTVAPAGVAMPDDDGLAQWQARKARRADPRPV